MKRVASGILPMLAVDGKGPKPLYRQIYDAYRMAIVEGSLRPGSGFRQPACLQRNSGFRGSLF